MTSKQLFNIIDGADDKFLKEAMEDDLQYPVILTPDLETGSAAKTKRRFPIKPIAACAACLALVFGLTFVGRNVVNEIDPLFGKPARGVITKIAEKDLIDYNTQSGITFGNFSYTADRSQQVTNSDKLSVTNQTTVSAEIKLSITFSEYGFPHDNVTARIFLLADGKPVDFTIDGKDDDPSWYKDFTLRNSDHQNSTYWLSDSFNIEFNASPENEQFTAVANFFPDEVFDMQESAASRADSCHLTAAQSIRNSAAKVSYDYKDLGLESPNELYFYGSDVIYTAKGITENFDGNEKVYALKKNLNGQSYVFGKNHAAFRQYFILDGKLLNCFGNEYLKELDCHGGEYFTLIESGGESHTEFSIPGGFLPGSGMHIISSFHEPIIPESIDERVSCRTASSTTIVIAENLKDLQKEADKFKEDGVTWYNSMYNPLRVMVHTDKTIYKKGEKIKVKATIRNYGTTPIQLYSPDSSAGVYMYISRSGSGGDLVNTDGYYERGVSGEEPTVLDLGPGEEYNVEFNFTAMVEKDGVKVKAPEGQYKGCLVYQLRESRSNGNGHTYTSHTNRVLKFTVYI